MEYNPIDFYSITKNDIIKLDFSDPHLIEQCQLRPILLLNHMTLWEIRTELMRNIVLNAIINYQYSNLMDKLKQTPKSNKKNKPNIASILYQAPNNNIIDFSSITIHDIRDLKLDMNDPILIDVCQLKTLSWLDRYTRSQKIELELTKNMIASEIINYQHNTLFDRMEIINRLRQNI